MFCIMNCSTGQEKIKAQEWSDYQGEMIYDDAMAKCESLGMRLPTLEEFNAAYKGKLTETWIKDGIYYWTPNENSFNISVLIGNIFLAHVFDVVTGSFLGASLKNNPNHVRCIR
jgi:hypothetical protein